MAARFLIRFSRWLYGVAVAAGVPEAGVPPAGVAALGVVVDEVDGVLACPLIELIGVNGCVGARVGTGVRPGGAGFDWHATRIKARRRIIISE